MATLDSEFNAEEVQPATAYEPVPPGKYVAMITESDRVPTANGRGEMLKLTWVILEGAYENRKVFDRLNLKNDNPQAVEIGLRSLSAICHAVGKLRVSDSAELHNIPLLLNVKIRAAGKDKNGIDRDAQNEVKGYEAMDGKPAAATAAAAAVTGSATRADVVAPPARTTTAPQKKPWEKVKG